MKKLVLVLVSAVFLTVFIAFNYLLWDRENKIKNFEYINDTKNSSIDTLRTELSDLKNNNSQLKVRITELEDLYKDAQLENSELKNDKGKIDKELSQKKETINMLIKQGDLNPLEETVKKWVESLDKGQLQTAYDLQYNHSLGTIKNITYDEFTKSHKNSYKYVKLKSIKLLAEELPKDRKGSIVYKVVLDIKKADNSSSEIFNDGANERYFSIDYDSQKKEWIITNIAYSL